MTAPTTNRIDEFKPEAVTARDRMRPIVLTNEISFDRR